MTDRAKICRTCRWYAPFEGVCLNGDSKRLADFTGPEETCPEWEGEAISMTSKTFDKVTTAQIGRCVSVLCGKAKEYATEDRLHNFRVAAALQGVPPERALAGMMAKHTVSVYDMCASGESYPLALWEEKITDSINYLLLLNALVREGVEVKV